MSKEEAVWKPLVSISGQLATVMTMLGNLSLDRQLA